VSPNPLLLVGLNYREDVNITASDLALREDEEYDDSNRRLPTSPAAK